MTPDWKKIRREYEGGASRYRLGKVYGVSDYALRSRIQREGWVRKDGTGGQEKQIVQKCERKPENADPGSPMEPWMERVAALADALLSCLERAVKELDTVKESVREKAKKEDGAEVTTDYERLLPLEKGIIDRGGLKQLTGVLKDLKDVLVLRPEADIREQEARIAKLQRELSREQDQTAITVSLEGTCQEYAQ